MDAIHYHASKTHNVFTSGALTLTSRQRCNSETSSIMPSAFEVTRQRVCVSDLLPCLALHKSTFSNDKPNYRLMGKLPKTVVELLSNIQRTCEDYGKCILIYT